jgi:hypothetical protein
MPYEFERRRLGPGGQALKIERDVSDTALGRRTPVLLHSLSFE